MNIRSVHRPRGYSLIEVVLVIGGVAIVLGITGGLLHSLLRLDRAGRIALNDTTAIARLARQFRQDVRRSDTAKSVASGLELDGRNGPPIAYRVDGNRLLREEGKKGAVEAREGYPLDRLGPVGFEVDGGRVRLVMARGSGKTVSVDRREIRVEARLGKDQTLADMAGGKK